MIKAKGDLVTVLFNGEESTYRKADISKVVYDKVRDDCYIVIGGDSFLVTPESVNKKDSKQVIKMLSNFMKEPIFRW